MKIFTTRFLGPRTKQENRKRDDETSRVSWEETLKKKLRRRSDLPGGQLLHTRCVGVGDETGRCFSGRKLFKNSMEGQTSLVVNSCRQGGWGWGTLGNTPCL